MGRVDGGRARGHPRFEVALRWADRRASRSARILPDAETTDPFAGVIERWLTPEAKPVDSAQRSLLDVAAVGGQHEVHPVVADDHAIHVEVAGEDALDQPIS